MSLTPEPSSRPPVNAEAVCPEDLAHLPLLHDVIGTLDDDLAGAEDIARAAAALPALAARIRKRFALRFPSRRTASLAQQIAVLGVRDFEVVLFELIEDLTVLRATMADEIPQKAVM